VAAFRALSAVGSNVWVGGTHGLLYHSGDGGNHWSRVILSANGIKLSDDIVHVDFSDSQHGKVVAGNGEIWATTDAGNSWHKE